MGLISRTEKIEQLEAELGHIREVLQVAMETTVIILSQRQQEMDRWYKLAAAQGRHLQCPPGTETEIVVQEKQMVASATSTADENGISLDDFSTQTDVPRLAVTGSGFIQVDPTSTNEYATKSFQEGSPLKE